MLSILIPTYNYTIYNLIQEISRQAEAMAIPYEIIVSDDHSSQYQEENKKITSFPHTKYLEQTQNLGRTKNRELLAHTAKYSWILFLDADVIPASKDFIKNYIHAIHDEIDLIFGGISYQEKSPNKNQYLRWFYGKHREAQAVEKRQKHPWFVISQNLLSKKELFLKANVSKENRYGLDNLFSHQLKKLEARIIHIDNPIIHLGLEENPVFLKKSVEAVETTIHYEHIGMMESYVSRLQKSYQFLKRTKLTGLFVSLIQPLKKRIERNLLGKSPSLFLFDLYKLYHYTRLKKNRDA
ncbi:glycosyltransferase family 2 protein [uncultured Dokdonia sp.]|uniref:glycosyltransferase family 2 protein n=1 Tax=uncultured Dokdonia sp. TaxID=575653 RepID=UPI002636BDB3|nr:glycosyltransferase family 2 protein [uncultured Dokdonia sp.]